MLNCALLETTDYTNIVLHKRCCKVPLWSGSVGAAQFTLVFAFVHSKTIELIYKVVN